jgi:hypothetical protein
MKLGTGIPQRRGVDLRKDIIGAARTAEAAGFSSLWTLLDTALEIRERAVTTGI